MRTLTRAVIAFALFSLVAPVAGWCWIPRPQPIDPTSMALDADIIAVVSLEPGGHDHVLEAINHRVLPGDPIEVNVPYFDVSGADRALVYLKNGQPMWGGMVIRRGDEAFGFIERDGRFFGPNAVQPGQAKIDHAGRTSYETSDAKVKFDAAVAEARAAYARAKQVRVLLDRPASDGRRAEMLALVANVLPAPPVDRDCPKLDGDRTLAGKIADELVKEHDLAGYLALIEREAPRVATCDRAFWPWIVSAALGDRSLPDAVRIKAIQLNRVQPFDLADYAKTEPSAAVRKAIQDKLASYKR